MKNGIKKVSIILLLFVAIVSMVFAACGDDSSNNSATNKPIVNDPIELSVLIGDEVKLRLPDVADAEDVKWVTANKEVATVSEDGILTAITVGNVDITAKSGQSEYKWKVSVGVGNQMPYIKLSNDVKEMTIGRSLTAIPFDAIVCFNGKEFKDVEITCKVVGDVLKIDEEKHNVIIPLDKGSAKVSVYASWRGFDFDDFKTLATTVTVNVVDEMYFWINDKPVNYISLYAIDEFNGQTYKSETEFNVTASFNGQEISENDLIVEFPKEIIEYSNGKIKGKTSGSGKIKISYTANGETFNCAVDVDVKKIELEYDQTINYFSSMTGTYKDEFDEYKDKTVISTLFGTDDVQNLKVYQGATQLVLDQGKIFGVKVNYVNEYTDKFTLDNGIIKYTVDVNIYGLVLQNAQDLKNFELKYLEYDNPETYGIDETKITCVDGYCALINNIDAKGVKIEHQVLLDDTYEFVNASGVKVSKTVSPSIYKHYSQPENVSGIDKFGFIGTLDGNGYTIFNLDVSVEDGEIGGGLLGYCMGSIAIKDLGFKNLIMSNSAGLTKELRTFPPFNKATDLQGIRIGNPVVDNVYLHISEDTVNPMGALSYGYSVEYYSNITNVIVDATALGEAEITAGGTLVGMPMYLYESRMNFPDNTTWYYKSENVYVVGNNIPASKDATVTVYGKNEAKNNPYNTIIDGKVYSIDFERYTDYNQLKNAGKTFNSFNEYWDVEGYPIFLTAKGATIRFNGVERLDDTIYLSSTTPSKLELYLSSGEVATQLTFGGYDSNKINIDADGNIKLVSEVTEMETQTVTINYSIDGISQSMELTVNLMPATVVIKETIELSANDLVAQLKMQIPKSQEIISVSQEIDGNITPLMLSGNKATNAVIKVLQDNSDVAESKLTVKTTDLTIEFSNAKIYSHVIKKGSDLKVFEHTATTSVIEGFYIFANDVDATGIVLNHHQNAIGGHAPGQGNNSYFNGIIDGRGHAIYNFNPKEGGLLGSVRSDGENAGDKAIIRNLGFINIISDQSTQFSVIAKYVDGVGGKVLVENIHVHIKKTYMVSGFNPVSTFKGLFASNSTTSADTFKMKNVYVVIDDEAYELPVYSSSGTILGRDNGFFNSPNTQDRFDNVITVAKAAPCTFRQYVGEHLANEFGYYMYFIYAENDIGKDGKIFVGGNDNGNSSHPAISHNPELGSFVFNGVYRYDKESDVESNKLKQLIDTGYWTIQDGKLCWGTKSLGTKEEGNFDIDWVGPAGKEIITDEQYQIEWITPLS